MGYTKEPVGIDLNLEPMPLSTEERQMVSEIIAQYKTTGKTPELGQKTHKKKLSQTGTYKRTSSTKQLEKKKAVPAKATK